MVLAFGTLYSGGGVDSVTGLAYLAGTAWALIWLGYGVVTVVRLLGYRWFRCQVCGEQKVQKVPMSAADEERSPDEPQESPNVLERPSVAQAPNYCPECGEELSEWGDEALRYCPSCGQALQDAEPDEEGEPREKAATEWPRAPTEDKANTSGTATGTGAAGVQTKWYRRTLWLFLGALSTFGAGVVVSPVSGSGAGLLFLLSFLLGIASIGTMYKDLASLEIELWDTRPALWVVGAVLLWIVIMPVYLYKRRQVPRAGDRNGEPHRARKETGEAERVDRPPEEGGTPAPSPSPSQDSGPQDTDILAPACLHCGSDFEDPPERRRTCESCGKVTFVKRHWLTREKTGMTEEKMEKNKHLHQLWRIVADAWEDRETAARAYRDHRTRMQEEHGPSLNPTDTMWRLLVGRAQDLGESNDHWGLAQLQGVQARFLVTEDREWSHVRESWEKWMKKLYDMVLERGDRREAWDLAESYYEMACFFKRQGVEWSHLKDRWKTLRQKNHELELEKYRDSNVVSQVKIVATDDSCDACRGKAGATLTVEAALLKAPLPVDDCTYWEDTKPVGGWCRCYYEAVVDG